jgi:AbrB family looped-hinge helix DNA binding protein
MKGATRVTSKGQVVIPKPVRSRLRWRPGTRLSVEEQKDGSVVLRPIEQAEPDRLYGRLAGLDLLGDLETEHRAEVAADERRRRRR